MQAKATCLLVAAMVLCPFLTAQEASPRDAEGWISPATVQQVLDLPDCVSHVRGQKWTDEHLNALARRERWIDVLDLRGNTSISFAALIECAPYIPRCEVQLDGCSQFWPMEIRRLYEAGVLPYWNVASLPDAVVTEVLPNQVLAAVPDQLILLEGDRFAIYAADGHVVGAMKGLAEVSTSRPGKATLLVEYTIPGESLQPSDILVHPLWHRTRYLSWCAFGGVEHLLGLRWDEDEEGEEPSEGERKFYDAELQPHRYEYFPNGHREWSSDTEVALLGSNVLYTEYFRRIRVQFRPTTIWLRDLAPFVWPGYRVDNHGYCHVDSDAEFEAMAPFTPALRVRNASPASLAAALKRMPGILRLDLRGCSITEEVVTAISGLTQLETLDLTGCKLPAALLKRVLTHAPDRLEIGCNADGVGPELTEAALPDESRQFSRLVLSGQKALTDEMLERFGFEPGQGPDLWMQYLDLSGCPLISGSGLVFDNWDTLTLKLGRCPRLNPEVVARLAPHVADLLDLTGIQWTAEQWAKAFPLKDFRGNDNELRCTVDMTASSLDAASMAHLARITGGEFILPDSPQVTDKIVQSFEGRARKSGQRAWVKSVVQSFPDPGKATKIIAGSTPMPDTVTAESVLLSGFNTRRDNVPVPELVGVRRLVLDGCSWQVLFDNWTTRHASELHVQGLRYTARQYDAVWEFPAALARMTWFRDLTIDLSVITPAYTPLDEHGKKLLQDFEASIRAYADCAAKHERARVRMADKLEPTDEELRELAVAVRALASAEAELDRLGRECELMTTSEGVDLSILLAKLASESGKELVKLADAYFKDTEDLEAYIAYFGGHTLHRSFMVPLIELGQGAGLLISRDEPPALRDLRDLGAFWAAELERIPELEENEPLRQFLTDQLGPLEALIEDTPREWRPWTFEDLSWPGFEPYLHGEGPTPEMLAATSAMTLRLDKGDCAAALAYCAWLHPLLTTADASGNSAFDDACVTELLKCTRLRVANLSGTAVTMKSVRALLRTEALRKLTLKDCKNISADELKALKVVFPDVVVVE